MNWLEIIYKIIIPSIFAMWIYWYLMFSKKDSYWYISPNVISCVIITLSVILLPIIAHKYEYTIPQVRNSGTIVSLENKSGISGNISGGGSFLASSFKGGINSTTTCSVLVKWNEKQMTIETIDCSDIIFIEGSDLSVKRFDKVVYYPHSLKGIKDLSWSRYVDHWEITIPAESINSYIKFN